MLKIEEFLDIKEIEQLRAANGKTLDGNDNFSWHIALKEDEKILGAARLYKYKDGLMLDKPCLYAYDKNYFEMLFRALLLKAVSSDFKYAYVSGNDCYYGQFGFAPCGDNMRAVIKEIKFPKLCGGCKGCD